MVLGVSKGGMSLLPVITIFKLKKYLKLKSYRCHLSENKVGP